MLYHTAAGSRVFTNTLAATHVMILRFTAADALMAVERHKVTMVARVPTMILNEPTFATRDLSGLSHIGRGGAPTPVATLEALIHRLPHVRFAQAFGMTELSRLVSAGRAALGLDVQIVDANDRELPRGTIGEVVVAGATVMKGYWNEPELTAEVLRAASCTRAISATWTRTACLRRRSPQGRYHDRRRKRLFGGGRERDPC